MSLSVNFPAMRPTLNLNFARARQLDPRITFTRATTATYFDSSGVLQTAIEGQPRFDFSPTTLQSLGLLIEEQRTNLALYSNNFTDASWVKTNITAALDQVGPDNGVNSASSLTATAGNGTVLQTITSASAARFETCYVKRITGTGVVEMTMDNGSTWTAVTVTSAWTRVSIPSQTVTNPVVGFRLVTDTDAIAVYGFQIENGAFATSVIPTTGSAATRNADVATMTGTNFSSWYNATEGTFYSEAVGINNISGATRRYAEIGNNTIDERFVIGYGSTTSTRLLVVDGGSAAADVSVLSGVPAGSLVKFAGAYKANDFQQASNSTLGTADTSGSLPTVTQMTIGSDYINAANTTINGHIQRIAYYPVRLSNDQLQALTR